MFCFSTEAHMSITFDNPQGWCCLLGLRVVRGGMSGGVQGYKAFVW